jgi:hypothetical protein
MTEERFRSGCHPEPGTNIWRHHYPQDAQPGTPCLCGQMFLADESYYWFEKREEVTT